MDLDEYQEMAGRTAVYSSRHISYPVLGLAGEAGEVVEKFKKLIRDHNIETFEDLFSLPSCDEIREALKKEIGDVLWYCSELARRLDLRLSEVAAANLLKLHSRHERGVIRGSGDDR